jgi:hypothetical protein
VHEEYSGAVGVAKLDRVLVHGACCQGIENTIQHQPVVRPSRLGAYASQVDECNVPAAQRGLVWCGSGHEFWGWRERPRSAALSLDLEQATRIR